MFSKACEYGIRSAIYIAGQSMQSRKVGLKEVAKEIDSPEAYTSKILQKLTKGNVIISEKGPTGGFTISNDSIKTLNLAAIVIAIDGDAIFKGCGLGLKKCNEKKPCPLHHKFKAVRNDLYNMLTATSIIELYGKIDDGSGFLKR